MVSNSGTSIFCYSYFFLPIVFPEILVYILVMLLSSIDFWVVKNIVGRKLVKMRWWFIIDEQGNERWHYESRGIPIFIQSNYFIETELLF